MFVPHDVCPARVLSHSMFVSLIVNKLNVFFEKFILVFNSCAAWHPRQPNPQNRGVSDQNWFVVEHILFPQMIKAIKLGLTTIYIADHKMGVHLSTKEEYC